MTETRLGEGVGGGPKVTSWNWFPSENSHHLYEIIKVEETSDVKWSTVFGFRHEGDKLFEVLTNMKITKDFHCFEPIK